AFHFNTFIFLAYLVENKLKTMSVATANGK
ncbi:unnamed protein product, partial [Rotaria magnacalcarata]